METQQRDNLLSDTGHEPPAASAVPPPHSPGIASDPVQRQLSELMLASPTRSDLERGLTELLCGQARLLGWWSVKTTGQSPGQPSRTPDSPSLNARSLSDPGPNPPVDLFVDWTFLSDQSPSTDRNVHRTPVGQPKSTKSTGPSATGKEALWEAIAPLATGAIEAAAHSGETTGRWLNDQQEQSIVVSPLTDASELLVACFASPDHSLLRQQWLLGMAGQTIRLWIENRKIRSAQTQNQRLQDAVLLLHESCSGTDRTAAAISIVNRLKTMLGAAQVSIGTINGKNSCRLLAVSDVDQPDAKSPICLEINTALSRDSECSATWSTIADSEEAANHSLPAARDRLQRFCDATGVGGAVNAAIPGESGLPVASLLVSFDGENIRPDTIGLIERMAALTGPVIELTHRAHRSMTRRIVESLSPRHLLRPAGLMFLAACLLMLVPAPYRMACECRLQPVLRRFVVAPYNGILDKTLVKVGEVVEEGQIIARMDGRERQIRLTGLQAQHEGARRKRESAMAKREVAESQIAASEMRSLRSQIQLIEAQMQDLEVRAPIAGIVVAGDLEKAQGAPMEAGQTLFEIAPLSSMVAEVQIPESEIRYVHSENPVAIKLNAFPFRTFEGTVGTIHPDSEVVDDQTVFIAEMQLANDDNALRPGMEGSAKIRTHWSPLGWNLFHKAWETARYWTVW